MEQKYDIYILNECYPIYNFDDGDSVVAKTKKEDMVVITYQDNNDKNGYFETLVISGEFIGYNMLALNKKDLKKATKINLYKEFLKNL